MDTFLNSNSINSNAINKDSIPNIMISHTMINKDWISNYASKTDSYYRSNSKRSNGDQMIIRSILLNNIFLYYLKFDSFHTLKYDNVQ